MGFASSGTAVGRPVCLCYTGQVPLGRVLILIWLILAGQADACSGDWMLPDGGECPTCVKGPCLDPVADRQDDQDTCFAPAEQDCHSCCTLTACDDHSESPSATQTSPQPSIEFVLPPSVTLPRWQIVVCRIEIAHLEQGFPNAPPAVRRSRGPPSN